MEVFTVCLSYKYFVTPRGNSLKNSCEQKIESNSITNMCIFAGKKMSFLVNENKLHSGLPPTHCILYSLTLYIMNTLANSEDPDKMQRDAAFHDGPHCLFRQKQSSEKDI